MFGVFLHYFGIDNVSGPWYAFYSGFGSIIVPPVLTAVPITWVLLRKHNCHVHRCWRIGRQAVEGTTFVVCRKHHTKGKPTAEHIHQVHRQRAHLYLGAKPGRG